MPIGHILKGKQAQNHIPADERPVCQYFCGVCGRTEWKPGVPCILVTVRHADGTWLSACRKCFVWWHIKDGTRVPRLIEVTDGDGVDAGGVPESDAGGWADVAIRPEQPSRRRKRRPSVQRGRGNTVREQDHRERETTDGGTQ